MNTKTETNPIAHDATGYHRYGCRCELCTTAATIALTNAAPDLLEVAQWILRRWEFEPDNAVFPGHASKHYLALAVAKATA